MRPIQHEILQTLAERIRETETHYRPQGRAAVRLGIPPLEELFPDKQLPAGSLIEMVSLREGDGAWSLALWLARQASGEGKAVVIADSDGDFYPPGAAALGNDWTSCIVVRPKTLRDAYLAAEYSLRCPAVGAVVARCGNLSPLVARRLQAAAELGGGIGLILRSAQALEAPAFATLRLLIRPLESTTPRRLLQVEVVRCRGRDAGASFVLEVDHASGVASAPRASPIAPEAVSLYNSRSTHR